MPRNNRTRSSGTGGHLLSADDIVGADDLKYEVIDVPEWGGKVRVRGLTSRERDDYEASLYFTAPNGQQKMNLSGARERLVARGMVDGEGNRLLSDADAGKLAKKNGRAMERVFDAIRRLSGMSKEDVESLVGNSEAAPSDAS